MANHTFDEVLDGVAAAPKQTTKSGLSSVYDQLREELSKPANVTPFVTLKVPSRDNIAVKFSTALPLEKLDRWRVASRKKKSEDLDVRLFNQLVIVSQCAGFVFNGEEAVDENGEALTFRSADVIEMLNALDAKGAVDVLYARDADILRIGQEILKAAGYDDEEIDDEDEPDPLD